MGKIDRFPSEKASFLLFRVAVCRFCLAGHILLRLRVLFYYIDFISMCQPMFEILKFFV